MLRGLNEVLINDGTPASIQTAEEGLNGYDEIHHRLMRTVKDPDIVLQLSEHCDPHWENIKKNIAPFFYHYLDLEDDESLIRAGKLITETEIIIGYVKNLAEETSAVVNKNSKISAIVEKVLLFIAFSIVLLFAFLTRHINHAVARPIGELTSIAEGFNRGDLSIMMDETRKDEFGSLAMYFNRATIKLNETTGELRKSTEELTALTGQLQSDIDKRKKVEAELKKSKAEAEMLSSAKSQFLANMSHEMRTPMNAVLGFSQLLVDTQLDDTQKDFIETIQSSGTILLNLINDTLDLSKIEADEIKLESIDFDLGRLAEDILKMVKPKLTGPGVELVYDIAENVPVCFIGDPTRIRQVMMNLLSNAIKFTHKGEIKLSLTMDVTSNGSPEDIHNIRISVKDTGIGISRDKHNVIFDLFTQEDGSTTRQYGGTGLGLSIVKRLTEIMGGTIELVSEQGKGSEFIVVLPLRKSAAAEDVDAAPVAISGLKDIKVMIIDDNEDARMILESCCHQAAMNFICTAASAKSALEWLEGNPETPDLILCDILMPEMDGREFAKKLRGDGRYDNVKLIAITTCAFGGEGENCREAGFDAYLPKPVFKRELFNTLRTVVGSKPGTGQIITRHIADELSLKGIRVLLVEDNAINIKVFDNFLKKFGCDFDVAFNGQEAIEKINENKYDVVFMDVQMPVMGGIEAIELIRKDVDKDIPVIALTAAAMKGDYEQCIASGMNDYLSKPVRYDKLKEVLQKWACGVS